MGTLETSGFHPSLALLLAGTALAFWTRHRFSCRRASQLFSMTLFTVLFWLASFNGRPAWPVDIFLFSDPLLALVHTLAGKMVLSIFLVSLLLIVLSAVAGRLFCSHLCPLGTLFDMSDRFLGAKQTPGQNHEKYHHARKIKFIFLLVMLWAALFGTNLLAFGDPMVIFTRFAAMVFYPWVMVLEDAGLQVLKPVAEWAGRLEVVYFELLLPAFEGAFFMAVLLVLMLLTARFQPRFWCRHICPLGALLGLAGRWAPYRRRVDTTCNTCNLCTRECPVGAIHEKGIKTDRAECIVCLRCVRVCPQHAVSFGFHRENRAVDLAGIAINRRTFIAGALGGLAAGITMRADMFHPSDSFAPLPFRHQGLIRPPGALPEQEFMQRCTRCGLCMRACPTNTLQPDWYRSGLEGLWAPRMDLRHAACDQDCTVCGHICPTGAIRPLTLMERRHARVGTAVILRDTCLPWARDERCLICEQQCPYTAIVFRRDKLHRFDLPVVSADRCNGCGRCEDKCPVKADSAIVVAPHGELRMAKGSFVEECRFRGIVLEEKNMGINEFRME